MPDKYLPTNWSWVNLGDVCEFVYGKGLTKTNRNGTGKYPVFGSNGVVGFHDGYLVEGPCLIVGRKGAAGEVHLSNKNCWPIDTTYYIEQNEKYSISYLYFVLKNLRLDSLDKSTAIPGLNRNDAYKLTIPLPPLTVQHKIVAKIEELFSELDSGVASLKKAKEQIKIYRQTVLASAFSGRLCRNLTRLPDGQVNQIPFGEQKNLINEIHTNSSPDHLNPIQVRNPNNKDERLCDRQEVEIEHLPYKQRVNIAEKLLNGIQEVTSINRAAEPQTQYGLSQDSLDSKISSIKSEHKSSESVNHENPGSDNYANNLPEGLKWVKLGEVIDSLQYGTSEKASSNGNGIQVLRMGNIQAGKLDYSSLKYIDVSYKDLNKYLLDYGDLLFNRTNSAELVGKSALYKKHFTKSIFASYLIRVKVNKSIYSSEFLNYYINSSYGKNYFKSVVSQNVGQANVNGTKLKSMDVPLVSLSQQNQIVEEIEKRFSEADNLEKAIDESLAKAESLRQSILKQAFEGRLV